MSDLAQGLMVAIRVHAGQVDKQGEPYLLHVLRVVEAVSDEAKAVAALHDAIEGGKDSALRGWTDGLSSDEIAAVGILTRIPTRSYMEYIDYIAGEVSHGRPAALLAHEVKLADLRDNLGRIPPKREMRVHGIAPSWEQEWGTLQRRYEKAIATLEAGEKT